MKIVVRIGGNPGGKNPKKKDLLKQVVMLVEKRQEIKKASNELHAKIETLENLKQDEEIGKLIEQDFGLFQEYGQTIMRENMLLNIATSTNKTFQLN